MPLRRVSVQVGLTGRWPITAPACQSAVLADLTKPILDLHPEPGRSDDEQFVAGVQLRLGARRERGTVPDHQRDDGVPRQPELVGAGSTRAAGDGTVVVDAAPEIDDAPPGDLVDGGGFPVVAADPPA